MILAAGAAADPVAARSQMGFSLGWHIILACFGVGLPGLVLFTEWRGLRTGDPVLRLLARRWAKALGLLFAVGAVSGTILSIEMGVRLAGFVLVLAINPVAFLMYWIALRLSVGFASFVFHHVLHSLDGRLGTFPLPVSRAVVGLAERLFGREPMLILTEHERHHEWPRVRARDLPLLPDPRA